MFKVQREEYVNKTFRMPAKLVKQLEELAQKEKVSLNNLIVQCCQYALDHLSIQSENEKREDGQNVSSSKTD